jgi:hypothetical protein
LFVGGWWYCSPEMGRAWFLKLGSALLRSLLKYAESASLRAFSFSSSLCVWLRLSFDAFSLEENGLDMRHFDLFSFSADVMFSVPDMGCEELAAG